MKMAKIEKSNCAMYVSIKTHLCKSIQSKSDRFQEPFFLIQNLVLLNVYYILNEADFHENWDKTSINWNWDKIWIFFSIEIKKNWTKTIGWTRDSLLSSWREFLMNEM